MKGLPNHGNTCYLNSALQCLLQVPQLSNYMILTKLESEDKFTHEYQKLVKTFWTTSITSINVIELLIIFTNKFPQFNNNNQQDCQEVFICILELLEESCPGYINKIFYSTMIQETLCKDNKSLKNVITNIHIIYPTKQKKLSNLIEDYQDWNIIENYEDNIGVKHYVASTRTIFKESSPVLVFSMRMYNEKIKIILDEFLEINNRKYELFCTSTHHGSTRGGHYVAYTKHKGQWFLKDDESSIPINKMNFNDFHYLALYKRIS